MAKVRGEGLPSLYLTSVMLALSWIFVITRLMVRSWKKILGLDDWFMVAGLLLYSVTACLVIVCCFYGAGQKSKYLTQADMMQGTKLFFIAEFFYASCTVPIKTSICVTLLRIADSRRRFVWTIWAIIVLVTLSTIIFIVTIANICHPITDLWGETTGGVCDPTLNSSVSFFFSAVGIVTDWTLAILPAMLLWNVQMKAKVKMSVAVMLGLAAFASCATIVRLRFLTLYNDPSEFLYSTGAIGLWSILEEGIGIIAGSMPALRPLLSLPIFGRSSNGQSNSARTPVYPSTSQRSAALASGHGNHYRGDSVKMDTFSPRVTVERDRKGSRGSVDDDGDSQKHILKQTHVTVTAEHTSAQDDWARQQVLGWEGNKP